MQSNETDVSELPVDSSLNPIFVPVGTSEDELASSEAVGTDLFPMFE